MIDFKVTPQMDGEIKRLHEEGFNIKSISNLTGVPMVTLREKYDFLLEPDAPAPAPGPISRQAEDEDSINETTLKLVADMLMEGKTQKAIAEATGLSAASVRKLVQSIKAAETEDVG